MGLRGVTLASRFLLIFFLARFIEPAELGLYGLLTATIGYSLYLLGFDFYTFTTREILKRNRSQWGGLLKDQIALSLLLYVIFLPLLAFVFVFELLPWMVAAWFFILLILEHVNQELSRLLIAVSEPLTASVVLFLRSGIWAIAVVLWMFLDRDARNLNNILAAWSLGSGLALVLGIYKLGRMNIRGWQKKIDWDWIVKGIRVALPLLGGTLAIRAIFTLDRYWFQSLVSLEVLGAYVLFIGMGSALMSFLDAGVFAFKYPGLISAFHSNDDAKFRHGMRTLLVQTVVLSIGFAVCAISLIHPLLLWLNKPLYIQHHYLFYWLLSVTILYAVGMIPHYGLYAQGKDRPIVRSHVAGFIIFMVVTWLCGKVVPELAVPVGLCSAFIVILLWKFAAYWRTTPAHFRELQFNIMFKRKQEIR